MDWKGMDWKEFMQKGQAWKEFYCKGYDINGWIGKDWMGNDLI